MKRQGSDRLHGALKAKNPALAKEQSPIGRRHALADSFAMIELWSEEAGAKSDTVIFGGTLADKGEIAFASQFATEFPDFFITAQYQPSIRDRRSLTSEIRCLGVEVFII
jgi:hypothetical protein